MKLVMKLGSKLNMKLTRLQVIRFTMILICAAVTAHFKFRLSWLWLGGLTLVFGPFFCGWVCPFGTISRLSNKIGKMFLSKWQIELSPGINKYLPIVKYGFFTMFLCLAIVSYLGISVDNKWQELFAQHRVLKEACGLPLALILSNYYCRYFCWHKAEYNLLSLLSPCAIRVDANKCSSCHACSKVCPMHNNIPDQGSVKKDCVMCMQCLEACPNKRQAVRLTIFNKAIEPIFLGIIFILCYLGLLFFLNK